MGRTTSNALLNVNLANIERIHIGLSYAVYQNTNLVCEGAGHLLDSNSSAALYRIIPSQNTAAACQFNGCQIKLVYRADGKLDAAISCPNMPVNNLSVMTHCADMVCA